MPLALTDLPAYRKIVMSDVTTTELTMEEVRKRGLPPDASLDYRFVMGRILPAPVKAGEPSHLEFLSVGRGAEPLGAHEARPPRGDGDGEGGRFGGRLRDARLDRRRRVSPRAHPRCALSPRANRRSCCLSRSTSSRWATVPFRANRPKAATTVTLALTSEQVDLVELVEGRGDLSLVLRGPATTGDVPRVLQARRGRTPARSQRPALTAAIHRRHLPRRRSKPSPSHDRFPDEAKPKP